MNNKQIISMILGYAGIPESGAARMLHRAPQSLNMTLKRDNLTLSDFIKLCNCMGMTIDIKDSNNNNIVLSLSATNGDNKTDAASEPEHATGGAHRQPTEPPRR